MGGPRLTPEQLDVAAEVFAKTGNTSSAAAAIGVNESTLRAAFARGRIARNRDLHMRAIETGLRRGRKHLAKALDLLGKTFVEELEGVGSSGLEPGEAAQRAGALATLTRELIRLTVLDLRRRQASLTRSKTRAEIVRLKEGDAGELTTEERAALRQLLATRPRAEESPRGESGQGADSAVAGDSESTPDPSQDVGP